MIRANSSITQNSERANEGDKWLGAPVSHYTGQIKEVARHIPLFARRPFTLTNTHLDSRGVNPNYDVIVRLPLCENDTEMPVGIVSKQYTLIQHRAVVEFTVRALEASDIHPNEVETCLTITKYGERMAFRVLLPHRFNFNPADGHPMGLRLECLNSVEGSTKITSVLAWLRLVCSNGLIVGVTESVQYFHRGSFNIDRIVKLLSEGLKLAEEDRKNFEDWQQRNIESERLKGWVNGFLRDKWGVKAAARFYHIAQTGYDADFQNPFEKALPTEKRMKPTKEVPGSVVPANNVFAMSQILSWLAKEHRDIQEQLRYTREIPDIMQSFLD